MFKVQIMSMFGEEENGRKEKREALRQSNKTEPL
jgi:hypothetical protein